jgi:hypothetical protein
MRFLLATTGLSAIAATLAASPASAETVISTAVTAPQSTSASGDIRITSAGSVKPASGVAVTLNTNNYVRNEGGTIQITGANNATGIQASANITGEITNSGPITIDESFTPTDSDNDGDLDGLFAQGSNRFGIRVLGPGTFTGNITNSGVITVEGNNSGGIVIDSAVTGAIKNSNNISVLGNDTVGLKAGDVSGNVSLSSGTITTQGQNATGVSLTGDIGGALVIQGTVQTTGYRYTTVPADVSKLDADDLLQGGSAVVIGGDVAGGILFDARPADLSTTDTDEDDDGVPDANESTASITSLGAAPAVLIGSATADTTIGAVAGSGGVGLVNKGTIAGSGLYKGIAGNGLVVGGLGHAVNVAGGLTNSGTISATAVEGTATAVRIGAGGTVPTITNSGTISATGAGTAATTARALVIDAGANVGTIRNSGSILATRSGAEGTAAAIIDNSGTVTLIENSGSIGVASAASLGDKAVAFDLRANGVGATVRQLAVTSGSAPSIAGQMLFGGGNDVLDVRDGFVAGAANFGAGSNQLLLSGDAAFNGNVAFGSGADSLQLAGTSVLNGNLDFGGGADSLTLAGTSAFTGQLANSAGLAVNVGAGSALNVTNSGSVSLASLTTGSGSTLGVTLDPANNSATSFNVSGAANIGTGTTLDVQLLSLADAVGTYTILQAGSLTGASNLTSSATTLPFLFGSSIDTSTANQISLVISRKTAEQLGINSSEAAVLDAVLGAADADAPVAAVFLGIADQEGLEAALQQMLPDHAGGAFENSTKGSRLASKILADPNTPLVRRGNLGFWLQQVAWGSSKAIGATSSYSVNGWGAAGGVETSLGFGNVGLSLSYLAGKDGKKRSDNELISNQYEAGLYWRGGFGPIRAFARGTVGMLDFDGTRFFTGNVGGQDVTREAAGEWKGRLYSAAAGVTYDARLGRLSLRPTASIEHYSLKEKGYTETGGGEAFDLTVSSRTSKETAAVASLALGYQLMGGSSPEDSFLRAELEGGRRQILSGSLGVTRARFGDGTPFTLNPEERTSGFLGGLRLIGGGSGIAVTGEVNAEQQQDKLSIGGRLGLQFTF